MPPSPDAHLPSVLTWTGVLVLAVALLAGGCATPPPAVDGEEDPAIQDLESPPSSRHSSMLEQLRESNRRAELSYKREELAALREARDTLDEEIASGRARGDNVLPLETRRDNLDRVISNQERLLQRVGD
jgi:hypothetical protein